MGKFQYDAAREEELAAIKKREEEDLARILSTKYKIPYVNLGLVSIDLDALLLVNESEAREAGLAIVSAVGKKLKIGVKNPTIPKTLAVLKSLAERGYTYELFLGSVAGLEHIWERYREATTTPPITEGLVVIGKQEMEAIKARVHIIADLATAITEKLKLGSAMDTTGIVGTILAGGLVLDGSDVHLETSEETAGYRLRIDGVLHEIVLIPHATYRLILSRIKLLSGLKLNVKNRPQDGRFTVRVVDTDIEIRTSTLPEPFGESVVMRILNPKSIRLSLEDLGMQQPVYEMMLKEIDRPNGMLLNTGPTGSGKTTTLYAFVNKLNTPDVKIITLENPIEYHLKGVVQTQVSREGEGDYTFDRGIQAILRQDPDIILVGEIRSLETARTAMQAALTGHLVFSTLHTNNAPATVPRLLDMGVTPNIMGPALNVAMAQRLLRKLCAKCKEPYKAGERELAFVKSALEHLPKEYTPPDFTKITIYKAKGCEACSNFGYKGRIGVYEVFRIDDVVQRLILKNPTEADVREAAIAQGMLTLHQDGILKIASGVTSIEELIRIAGEVA